MGDKVGLAEIEAAGVQLNRLYQQDHPDRDRAPDDFRHPDVVLSARLLETSLLVKREVTEQPSQNERYVDRGPSL